MKKKCSTLLLLTLLLFTPLAAQSFFTYVVGNPSSNEAVSFPLDHTWQLEYISGQEPDSVNGLFPSRIPVLFFNSADQTFSGNNGCNSITGSFMSEGQKLIFSDNVVMTRMMCPGSGEQLFLETLKKVDTYTITGNMLNLSSGSMTLMKFTRK